ncbi:hypothetical protein WUBG_18849 [Wuchereria bancrofti]|uniref:Uncharacterized protein n=1 Tax=Wuchereria bancrofti TaxID=6293 RepID=J9E4E5_WUCBA|nr:hypothetical protein WUBG_18849 [Wuchereria bancrofti]
MHARLSRSRLDTRFVLSDLFDVMCKELCSINEETEKQVIELQLEIETTKDIKNVISAYEETLGMLRIMVGLFFAVFVC